MCVCVYSRCTRPAEGRRLSWPSVVRLCVCVQPVDYESLSSAVFNVTVYVSDPDTSHVDTAHIELSVTDANDNAPLFSPNQQRISIYENVSTDTTLYRFIVTDRDTGPNKQFTYV